MAALPQLRSPTIDAIESAVSRSERREQDKVVRLSSIGKCERHLWYRFRWAHEPEEFEPRILRLFETGHLEEARMVGWLERAGVKVWALDPETGEQWEVTALGGHVAGHLDGLAVGIAEAPKTAHLLECKTHNAKSFASLLKQGVQASKPEHYAQMQAYMHLKGLNRAFYLAKNKATDELHAERIEYDPLEGARLMAKAERIATTDKAPAKISEDPNSWLCRFCASNSTCHFGDFALRNCRTCIHSEVVLDGDATWRCIARGVVLDAQAQRRGCGSHLYFPSLVPGEQVDSCVESETITYRLSDGSTWVDGPTP